MRLFRNLSVNFKMIFANYGFYLCAGFTLILCLCTSIYRDPTTNESFSVFRVMREVSRDEMLMNVSLCSFSVIGTGTGSWLSMFIPIVSAFAFIPLSCDKAESGALRSGIFRSSRAAYGLSEFLSAGLSGALAVMLGFVLFALVACAAFPSISAYPPMEQEMLWAQVEMEFPGSGEMGAFLSVGMKCLSMFLYGFVWAAPAVMLTAFTRNKYLVICIPFFIKYAITQTCVKMISGHDNTVTQWKVINTVSPDSLMDVSLYAEKYFILLYNLLLVIVEFAVYAGVSRRRFDCGA